jgi:hypothetical protein
MHCCNKGQNGLNAKDDVYRDPLPVTTCCISWIGFDLEDSATKVPTDGGFCWEGGVLSADACMEQEKVLTARDPVLHVYKGMG